MAQNRDELNKRRQPAQNRQSPSAQKPRNPKPAAPSRKPSKAPQSRNTPQGKTPPRKTTAPRKPQTTRKAAPPQKTKGGNIFGLRLVVLLEVVAVLVLGVMLFVEWEPDSHSQAPTSDTVQTTTPPPETAPPPTETDPPETEPPVTAPTVTDPTQTEPSETQPAYVPESDNAPTTVIHVAAAGDLNINDATVSAGKSGGRYDYTDVFMDVAPVLSGADLAVLNFEGNLVGTPYGTSSVSAPQELAEALDKMGVDLVQVANSHSVTHGIKGLATTLNNVRAAGLEPLGAFASAEEYQRSKGYTIVNVKGIRIAFVAFTKGVGGLSLPAGSEDCVNLLYTDYATTYQNIDKDGILETLKNVSMEKPDITIAMVHWGSEYKDSVTNNQKKIADILQSGGVDVILGTHSHMLHQIDYDPLTGELVAYSLGDFFGETARAGTEYSIILDLEITRDNVSGQTRVSNYTYTPIYTLTGETAQQTRVVRLEQTMAAYEENFVGKVSQSVYESMEHALKRVEERIHPKPEKKE